MARPLRSLLGLDITSKVTKAEGFNISNKTELQTYYYNVLLYLLTSRLYLPTIILLQNLRAFNRFSTIAIPLYQVLSY